MFPNSLPTVLAVRFHRAADLDDLHFASLTKLEDRWRGETVGDEDVDFREMRDAHWRRPGKLAAVGDQNDFTRVLNDRARYLHFANIEVQEGAGLVDRRSADHREINAELFDLLDRDSPDNTAVALSHRAAGEEDFDGAASVQLACDVKVVGDDQEAGMSRKSFRNLFRRCANVDEKR